MKFMISFLLAGVKNENSKFHIVEPLQFATPLPNLKRLLLFASTFTQGLNVSGSIILKSNELPTQALLIDSSSLMVMAKSPSWVPDVGYIACLIVTLLIFSSNSHTLFSFNAKPVTL